MQEVFLEVVIRQEHAPRPFQQRQQRVAEQIFKPRSPRIRPQLFEASPLYRDNIPESDLEPYA